jgi:hypothetical protein
LYQGYAREFLP